MQKFSLSFGKAFMKDPSAMDVDNVEVYKPEWSEHTELSNTARNM